MTAHRFVVCSVKHKNNNQPNSNTVPKHQLNNMHHTLSKSELITYLHQCMFSPTTTTLTKAIQNNQLLGISVLTADAVRNHSPLSSATIKGHLTKTRKNLRPMETKINTDVFNDMSPTQETNATT